MEFIYKRFLKSQIREYNINMKLHEINVAYSTHKAYNGIRDIIHTIHKKHRRNKEHE
jgi:hypothetical protein